MPTNDEIILKKIVVEAIHNKNIDIQEHSNKIGNFVRQRQRDFPHSHMDYETNSLVLINNKKTRSAILDANRVLIDSDNPSDITDFKNAASGIIVNGASLINQDSFLRLGIRSFWGIKFNSAEESSKCLSSMFLKQGNIDTAFPGSNKDGFHLGFITFFNGFKSNVNIACASEQKIEISGNTSKNIATNFLYFDIDLYKDTTVEISDVFRYITDAYDISKNQAYQFVSFIKEGSFDGTAFATNMEAAITK